MKSIIRFVEWFVTSVVGLFFADRFDRSLYHFSLSEVWYTPWDKDERFNAAFQQVNGYTLVSKRKLYDLYQLAGQYAAREGAWLEVGTLKGGTAGILASRARADQSVICWDNWGKVVESDDYFVKKIYSSTNDLATAKKLIASIQDQTGCKAQFVDCVFPDVTLVESWAHPFSLIHFDIYSVDAFVEGIQLLWPRIERYGVFIVSAYGSISLDPLNAAVNEFVRNSKDCVFVQSQSGMGLIFKTS
jgi:hypothetical protein